MAAIKRGVGVTESEKYLATLADKTFLRLWSYPNTFIDKKDGKNKIGKELADLLVVCGDDVIIFSDKSIDWPDSELSLAWSRWYRRAVASSVDQLRGAERWLREFSNRIFLDPECTVRFPIDLPGLDKRRVHRIAVAVGANDACRRRFGGAGTLLIQPEIKGDAHHDTHKYDVVPFAIGDADPDRGFVHVFDPHALDLVLYELDTVTDFTRYLLKREELIRSNRLAFAPGEEELLALYLRSVNDDGDHDFVKPDGTEFRPGDQLVVESGLYDWLLEQPLYQRKKIADKPSYVWDSIIDLFVDNVLAGTTVALLGHSADAALSERGLRVMATEDRMYRRVLGEAIGGALLQAEAMRAPRFVRKLMPAPGTANRTTAYVFLILAYPEKELEGGYEQYRQARAAMLEAYCIDLFDQHSDLELVVGIGVDASEKVTGRKNGSEDLVVLGTPEWTPELRNTLAERRALYTIRKTSELEMTHVHVEEYPDEGPAVQLSRQQRRAAMRARTKGR